MPIKVILDTDIGSDIDDAVCLAYLLSNPECQLLGVTTVTGEGVARARMADAICRVAGKPTPIFVGAERPLIVPKKQSKAPQAVALSKWAHSKDFPEGRAIDFLRDTIRAAPHEVTLLTIGPLTNVGLLFAAYPDVAPLLKSLVIMGGHFAAAPDAARNPPLEWNIINDPHAAAIVYRAPVRLHRSIGLDVTLKAQMPAEEVRRRFTHPLLAPVRDLAEVWFAENRPLVYHDPLAAATIFDPGICTYRKGRVEIELSNAATEGLTRFSSDGQTPAPHEVAATVEVERFFRTYFANLGGYS
jgi:purine nucleosidase